MVNSASIRATIYEGPIVFDDILSIDPFNNSMGAFSPRARPSQMTGRVVEKKELQAPPKQ